MTSSDSRSNVTDLVTSTRKSPASPKPKRGPGQPTKLNATIIENLATLIGQGSYLVTACNICGIAYPTWRDWMSIADEDIENDRETMYTKFSSAIKRAEADNEHRIAQLVIQAAQGGQVIKTTTTTRKDGSSTTEEVTAQPQWLAGMTYLERRHPDRWGRKDRHQVEINESKNITITHVEVVKDYGLRHAEIVEGEIVKKK